jgi:hypothetical protein
MISANGLPETSNTGDRAPLDLVTSHSTPVIPEDDNGIPWTSGFYIFSGNSDMVEIESIPMSNTKPANLWTDADYKTQYVFPGGNFEKIRAVKEKDTITKLYAVR